MLTDWQKANLATAAEQAKVCQAQTGFPACVSVAQWAIESGWGKATSGKNNYFGIKAGPSIAFGERELVPTTEWFTAPQALDFLGGMAGRTVKVRRDEHGNAVARHGQFLYDAQDWFRRYESMADAFADHARLFMRTGSPYAEAWAEYQRDRNAFGFVCAIAHPYSTSPTYAQAVGTIMAMSEVRAALK